MIDFFKIMMEKTGKVNSKFLGIQCLFISIMKSLNFKRKDCLSRFFEIGFTSVNQCFLKFIWKFFIENRLIFQYFRFNFLFFDENFWLITFQILPVFEFSLKGFQFFLGFVQDSKIGFGWWFWSFETKFGQKILFFSENFVNFFNIGK